jgi:hypothetical protein
MTDIDFLVCEYDTRVPVAVVDYKHLAGTWVKSFLAGAANCMDANIEAMCNLGDLAGLPALAVIYQPEHGSVAALPLNEHALAKMDCAFAMSEREYVCWLYRLRDRCCPMYVQARLETEAFPVEQSIVMERWSRITTMTLAGRSR